MGRKRTANVSNINVDPAFVATAMFIGDSITTGAPDGGFRVPIFNANPGLDLKGQFDFKGRHESISGFRIDQIAPIALAAIDFYLPKVALVMAGTNDINQGQSGASTLTEMQTFATDILAKPSVDIVLVSTIPYLNAFPVEQAAYNAGLLAWAAPAGITVTDTTFNLVFPGDFFDGLHPNSAGYTKIANNWIPVIQSVVF